MSSATSITISCHFELHNALLIIIIEVACMVLMKGLEGAIYYEWLYTCDAHSDYMSGALIDRSASALMALLALIQMYL